MYIVSLPLNANIDIGDVIKRFGKPLRGNAQRKQGTGKGSSGIGLTKFNAAQPERNREISQAMKPPAPRPGRHQSDGLSNPPRLKFRYQFFDLGINHSTTVGGIHEDAALPIVG